MPREQMAPWLHRNLELNTYTGLYWEEYHQAFRVTWEKRCTKGYEKMLEVCRGYQERGDRKSSLDDCQLRNRFLDCIKKSPYIKLLDTERGLQENNYLRCSFINFPDSSEETSDYNGSANESSKSNMSCEDMMECENASESTCQISGMVEDVAKRALRISSLLSDVKAELDLYRVNLHYDGKEVAHQDIDLSNPHRFHYGDARKQLENAKETLAHKPEDSRIIDLELPCMTFPPYTGDNKKTKQYLEEAVDGITLKSENGCLTVKRLSQIKIYRNCSHSGKFTKMNRRMEEKLFSYETYIENILENNPALNDEIVFAFGKKPEPGIAAHVYFVVTPILTQRIRSHFNIPGNESCSRSTSDSIERLNKAFRDVTQEVQTQAN